MTTRDEYVEQLKKQLDGWNAEITRWETRAQGAREEAEKRYRAQLDELASAREKARYNLKLLEGASALAWTDLRTGVDVAWSQMRDAMKEARSHFEKEPAARV